MPTVRFTRKRFWPCEVSPDTPKDEIETREVAENETHMKDGRRVYNLPGTTITLPVCEE